MRVLYVTHNSMRSALVRSQVLPYINGLRARGHEISLVTYERDAVIHGSTIGSIPWHSLTAQPGGHLAVKLLDIFRGVIRVLTLVKTQRITALHARSYIPAAICWVVSRLSGRPYIFDMRGFLGDEYVEGGHWSRRDLRYTALRSFELSLIREAAEIVVLTHAAAERLRREPAYAPWIETRPISVIPCAVDTDLFRPRDERPSVPTLTYAGSLGMSYSLDAMLRVFAHARQHVHDLRLRVLNRDDHALIWRSLAELGIEPGSVDVRAADFAEMPQELARSHVGMALLRPDLSKRASSPIKIAEYLACGLPTLVNVGVGEIDDLIARSGAGHVLRDLSDGELRDAGAAVAGLIHDRTARANARALAERVFSLESAVSRYAEIYDRIGSSANARVRLS